MKISLVPNWVSFAARTSVIRLARAVSGERRSGNTAFGPALSKQSMESCTTRLPFEKDSREFLGTSVRVVENLLAEATNHFEPGLRRPKSLC
jgi:hypothetical protein